MPPRIVGLTDEQIATIERYAAPLHRRSEFLAAVLEHLAGLDAELVGEGSIGRVCRTLAPQYFDPPNKQPGPRHGARASKLLTG